MAGTHDDPITITDSDSDTDRISIVSDGSDIVQASPVDRINHILLRLQDCDDEWVHNAYTWEWDHINRRVQLGNSHTTVEHTLHTDQDGWQHEKRVDRYTYSKHRLAAHRTVTSVYETHETGATLTLFVEQGVINDAEEYWHLMQDLRDARNEAGWDASREAQWCHDFEHGMEQFINSAVFFHQHTAQHMVVSCASCDFKNVLDHEEKPYEEIPEPPNLRIDCQSNYVVILFDVQEIHSDAYTEHMRIVFEFTPAVILM